MKDNIADLSTRNVNEVQNINRELIEQALKMRCASYLSQIKAKLLTETIYEIDSSKKHLQKTTDELLRKQKIILRQKQKLEEKNGELLGVHGRLEEMVRIRTSQLEKTIVELQESEERYSTLFKNSYSVMLLVDPESAEIVDANQAACSFYGWNKAELLTKKITDLNIQDKTKIFKNMKMAKTKMRGHFIFQHRLANGEIKDIEVHSSPVKLNGRDLLYSIIHDITNRIQTEKALAEIELQRREAVNASGVGLWNWLLNTEVVHYSNQWKRQIGYADHEIEDDFHEWEKRVHPEDLPDVTEKIEQFRTELLSQFETEFRFRHKNGSYRWILAKASLIKDENGHPIRMIGSHLDITQRVLSEKKIEASLQEKELLLQEVHHRVKNNLAVIISLLNLQSNQSSNSEIISALSDSRDRVKSMSLIHETLYRSENLGQIELVNYVTSLGNRLLQVLHPDVRQVAMIYDVEDISLDLDQAIPFGLILNELLTNALKYAFPGAQGRITVTVRRSGEDEVALIVHDNGIGLPEKINLTDFESLGLSIVSNLVKNQLEGILDYSNDHGARFSIRWPRVNA